MTVTFDASLLTAYYQARAGLSGGLATSSGSGTGAAKKNPTAPWATASSAPKMSDLVTSVMAGKKFIDPDAAKLDVANASPDYKKLFSLYQGLNALEGLAEQMNTKGLSETRKSDIRSRFNAGMAEIGAYLDKTAFSAFQLGQGTASASQTAPGIKRETDTYSTGTLWSGAAGAPVDAFQGATVFSLALTKPSGTVVNVDFDLAEMGATPRTMANVTIYLNDKLTAAGAATRFAVVRTPGAERTATAGGQTISLGTGPDTYALQLKGVSTEVAKFSAPTTSPSVYLGETVGATTGTAAAPVRQLLKYETDPAGGATAAADGKVFTKTLGPEVQAVRASQTAADGSLYVLADINSTTSGEVIKGTADVALMKYDSAGNLVYSRTLGAASKASGYALTVSADGSKVAVAGSVTGALDSGVVGADAKLTDSFVTVFDAQGQEVWTQRSGATADDQVNGVSFAADGSLYVTGTTASAMPGATAVGGQDAYIRGFKPNAAGDSYATQFTTQYGTTGTDTPSSIAVNGTNLVAAGVENGHVVLRSYTLQPTGAPVLAATRDLGLVSGGSVAGVAFAADGSVVVAGSTHNGALSAGTVTTAYTSGQSAFVAKLSGDLAAAGTDRLTYYNGAGDRSTTAVTLAADGKVYLAGQIAVTPPPGQTTAFDGYAAAIDPTTGAVSWSATFQGADRQAAPSTIAVDVTGSSVLDRLGLPSGTIDYSVSQRVTANSAVRAGDQFYVRSGTGAPQAVTIEATDTLKTLATKIGRAAGFNVKVEVVISKGYDTLKITPASSRTPIEIEAGKTGRNALTALGLTEGLITSATDTNTKDSVKASYALQLPSTLNLDSDGAVKQAQAQLLGALSNIRSIYRDMTTVPTTTTASGTVPAYLTAQIANYQQALNRLTGGA
ncbi:MAG TPA: transcriptional regulator [Caulobacteraceae bacterium]|nr:transcriptional regulator [Caulobacteraceae bacterium]